MDPLAFLNSELAPFIPGLNAFTLPIVLSAAALSKSSGVDEKVGQKSPHGGDVYYAGKDYGYQSPASYKKATGEYPEGYDIELGKKELRGGKPVFYAGKDYGVSVSRRVCVCYWELASGVCPYYRRTN